MISELVKNQYMSFKLAEVYPEDFAVERRPGADIYDLPDTDKLSFSRYSWRVTAQEFAEAMENIPVGMPRFRVKTTVETFTTIGRGRVDAAPSGHDLPDDLVIGDLAITFVVFHLTNFAPHDLEKASIELLNQIKVPGEMWPYWSEALHSFAMRARLPLPTIDAFRGLTPSEIIEAMASKSVSEKQQAKKRTTKKNMRANSEIVSDTPEP